MTDVLSLLRRERDEIDRAIAIQSGRLTELIARRDELERKIAEVQRDGARKGDAYSF